jgi:hypothetical protein
MYCFVGRHRRNHIKENISKVQSLPAKKRLCVQGSVFNKPVLETTKYDSIPPKVNCHMEDIPTKVMEFQC